MEPENPSVQPSLVKVIQSEAVTLDNSKLINVHRLPSSDEKGLNASASEKTSVYNHALANAYSASAVSSRGSSARMSGR